MEGRWSIAEQTTPRSDIEIEIILPENPHTAMQYPPASTPLASRNRPNWATKRPQKIAYLPNEPTTVNNLKKNLNSRLSAKSEFN